MTERTRIWIVRPRRNWWNLVLLAMACLLGAMAVFGVDRAMRFNAHADSISLMNSFGALCASAACLYCLWAFVCAFFGSNEITAGEGTLLIDTMVAGFTIKKKSYVISDLRWFRYEEWSAGRSGTQSALRFDHKGRIVTFAIGIHRETGWDVADDICVTTGIPGKPAGMTSVVIV